MAPPEVLSARIRTAIAATPAPRTSTRSRVHLAVAAAPLLSAAVLLVASHMIFGMSALREDIAMLSPSELPIALLPAVALALAATTIAIGRGKRGLGRGAIPLLLLALLVTPIYALLSMTGPFEVGEAAAASLAGRSPWGLRCLAIAAAAGQLVLATFTSALRRSAPVASRLRGAAVGAAAGAWAGLTVFVFCPDTELRHVLVGHVLPVAVLTVLGLVAIPRALRP